MNAVYTLGRIALVAIFVLSGVGKLLDIGATANQISNYVSIPALIVPLFEQLEGLTGMTRFQLLAIAAAALELVAALLVIVNLGARAGAVILIVFTMVATFYFHDFWNMTGPDRIANMQAALRNLSIIGGLLMVFAIGPRRLWMNGRVV